MDTSILVRRQRNKWIWGSNRDMFFTASQLLSKLAGDRKKAVLYFSTKAFPGAKKLVWLARGCGSEVEHEIYKAGRKKVDICQDWLWDRLGATRKIIYAKIMWL